MLLWQTLALALSVAQCALGLSTHPLSLHGDQLTLERLKTLLKERHSHGQSNQLLLGTRLSSLALNRTRIGPSQVKNAGRGLFATRDCQNGELLACYPGDVLLLSSSSSLTRNDGDSVDTTNDDDILESFIWGPHVSESLRISDSVLQSELAGYILQATDELAVIGLPTLDHDMAYAGHFANDGARRPPTTESQIAPYVLESNEVSNAMHISLEDGCHMVTIATRDISKDDEILVTYGPEYWMELAADSWAIDKEDDENDRWKNDESSSSLGRGNGKGFG